MAGRRQNNKGGVWWDSTRERWRGRYDHFGKEHFVTGMSKREVIDKLAKLRELPRPTEYTFKTAADRWMTKRVKPLWRKSTCRQYDQSLRNHLIPVFGNTKLEDVTSLQIQQAINIMAENKKAASTMGHVRKTCHVMFEWYVDLGLVEKNPCRKILIPHAPTPPRRSLSPKEIAKLKESLQASRWGHSINFLLLTGLRRGELLALQWTDIADGWISITRSLSPYMEVTRPKSNAGCRRFLLPKAAQQVLDAQKQQLVMEDIQSDYVFPNLNGTAMNPRNYSQRIMRIAKDAGLDFSVHELRHTFVSTLGPNINLHALQTILGHSKATHTMDIYGHLIDGALEDAAAKMDEIISGKKKRKPRSKPKPPVGESPKILTMADYVVNA